MLETTATIRRVGRAALWLLVCGCVLESSVGLCAADLQTASPPGGFNFQVLAHESLADRLFGRQATETGDVRDVIVGTDVVGQQTTSWRAVIDFRPCPDGAQFDVVQTGVTRSQTASLSPHATVYVCGMHHFRITKPVLFDGRRFLTQPPTANVLPHTHPVGIRTPLSGLPMLGPLAEAQASQRFRSRQFQADVEAATLLSDRTTSRFQQTVDGQLAHANRQLRATWEPELGRWGWKPETVFVRTDEQRLWLRGRFGTDSIAVPAPANVHRARPGELAVVSVHESLFNSLLDRAELAGRSLTDRQLSAARGRLRRFLSLSNEAQDDAEPTDAAAPADQPQVYTVLFDEAGPIRVAIDNGTVTLTIRAAIQIVGANPLPAQQITIGLRPTVAGDTLHIETADVQVIPAGEPAPDGDARVQELIRQELQSQLKPLQLQRKLTLPVPGDHAAELTIARVVADGGWLSVYFQ